MCKCLKTLCINTYIFILQINIPFTHCVASLVSANFIRGFPLFMWQSRAVSFSDWSIIYYDGNLRDLHTLAQRSLELGAPLVEFMLAAFLIVPSLSLYPPLSLSLSLSRYLSSHSFIPHEHRKTENMREIKPLLREINKQFSNIIKQV